VYDLDSITDAYCTNVMVGAQTISISGGPQLPIIAGDTIYCKNSNVQEIYVTNAQGTINWYSDSAQTISLGSSISFLPSNQETQTYYATESFNGCEGQSASITITIEDCPLIIPTAFTPNGDGKNDVWEIIGLDEQFPENSVMIFNRWGETIYESITGNYSNKPWNGKFKEGLLPVSSYYFVIQRSRDGSVEPLSGTVSIILKK
jgi:gliding motility-associated-like protein